MNTSIYIERVFDVEYDFQPFEPATNTYPGAVADVTITHIALRGIDVTDAFDGDWMPHLREQMLAEHLLMLRERAEEDAAWVRGDDE